MSEQSQHPQDGTGDKPSGDEVNLPNLTTTGDMNLPQEPAFEPTNVRESAGIFLEKSIRGSKCGFTHKVEIKLPTDTAS